MINLLQTKLYAGWQIDNTFSSDGIFTHDNAAGGNSSDMGYGLVIMNDKKIIIAGTSMGGSEDITIWKINIDGTLDTAFGSGNGFVIFDNVAGGGVGVQDIATDVALQTDSKIIVTGYSTGSNQYDLIVMRLNFDGSLDTSFGGGDGIFIHNNAAGGNGQDKGNAIYIQSDSKILIVGSSDGSGTAADLAVWRLTTNGTLDMSFGGGDGIFTQNGAAGGNGNDAGNAIIMQTDQKILITGYSVNSSGNSDMTVWRLNNDGTSDNTFNASGYFFHNNAAGGNGWDIGYSINITNDSKIYISGNSAGSGSGTDMTIWKVNQNGSLDVAFDGDGFYTHNGAAGGNANDVGNKLIYYDSCLIVVGTSFDGSNNRMVIWKFDKNSLLDTSFFSTGIYVFGSVSSGNSIIIDSAENLKYIITGYKTNSNIDMAVWSILYIKPNTLPNTTALISPLNLPLPYTGFDTYGRTLNKRPKLSWICPTDNDSNSLHFKVYCDTFSGTTILANSSTDTRGFYYFNGTTWDTFKSTGIDSVYYGNTVCFKPQSDLSETIYFWTVQAYDSFAYGDSVSIRHFRIGGRNWTDGTITSGSTPIRKIHVDELREEINYARKFRGLSAFNWTDSNIIASQTLIRKTHIDELRTASEQAANAAFEPIPVWTDSTLTPGQTLIRQIHFDEMRQKLSEY